MTSGSLAFLHVSAPRTFLSPTPKLRAHLCTTRPHPASRRGLVICSSSASNGTPPTSNAATSGQSPATSGGPAAASAAEASDTESRIAALEERLRAVSHSAALRDELLGRVADAVAVALTSDAAAAMQTAVTAAADARAAGETVRRALAATRDRAAASAAKYSRELELARSAVSALEKRVQFLANSVAEKDLELRARAEQLHGDGPHPTAGDTYLRPRPLVSAVEARACLASLLLYPALAQHSSADDAHAESTRRTRLGVAARDNAVPEFNIALLQFLDILSPFEPLEPQICGPQSQGIGASYAARRDPSRAVAAYGSLWRSVATPGRKGWRGEIVQALLSRGNSLLIADARLKPLTRRALAADLRALQALFVTPPRNIITWLCGAAGVTEPLLELPEYVATSAEQLTEVPQASPDVAVSSGFAKPAEEERERMTSFLSGASDWGHDEVVDSVLHSICDCPSQVSSVADVYCGLRWTANGLLEGVLSMEDVNAMPESQFVGIEHIRDRLCQNCEFLLNGLTANNVHMYGPPGSGKSSCVMSLLKEFGPRGLRIIEVTKETLGTLPDIFDTISGLRQKFVIFIDDLTFDESESEMTRVAKVALEGSLKLSPRNAFVVCTSNRRFPVGSRQTDATEEKLAFSYRFGIILSFPRICRADYLRIVHALADEQSIIMGDAELEDSALKWALGQDGNSNSLSGRTARQFVDYVASAQALLGPGCEELFEWSGNKNASAIPSNSLWTSEQQPSPPAQA